MGHSSYEISIDEWISEVVVTLELCQGSVCERVETLIDTALVTLGEHGSRSTATATPKPTKVPPSSPPPFEGQILPFPIADSYDEATMSYGGLSYAGSWVILAFGASTATSSNWGAGWDHPSAGKARNPDMWLEIVPGTIIVASVSGTVRLTRQELYSKDPEGIYEADWELVIFPDDEVLDDFGRTLHWVSYDHMVDMMVEDGQRVEQGQQLGQGAPARINRFEWGIRRIVGPDGERMSGGKPWAVCPEHTLIPEHQEFLKRALEQMVTLGFPSGDSTCLLDEYREGE